MEKWLKSADTGGSDSELSVGGGGGHWSFHNESIQPKSVTENTHKPLQRQREALRAHKHSLSYNRMELPLWPHKQREALWTLHKCLVLRGWTALEAGGDG